MVTSNGRDAQLALLMAARWRDEIESAIDRVKKSLNRSGLDCWLKREHELAKERTKHCQIGEHGGDENGREKAQDRRPLGAAHRLAWSDPILHGPEIAAVQERQESTRLRGLR